MFFPFTLQFVPERRKFDYHNKQRNHVGHLVSLLAWRRAVAGVSLVLIGLGRLELRRGPGLEVSRVLGALRSRRGPVVLLELQGVLRVELGLLLQPPVILLLVLSVLRRV